MKNQTEKKREDDMDTLVGIGVCRDSNVGASVRSY